MTEAMNESGQNDTDTSTGVSEVEAPVKTATEQPGEADQGVKPAASVTDPAPAEGSAKATEAESAIEAETGKPTEAPKGDDGEPEVIEYDWQNLPEGSDRELIQALEPKFKELGLKQDQVEALMEAYNGFVEQDAKIIEDARVGWEKQLQEDPEFGQAYDENVAAVRGFFEATAPAEIKQDLLQVLDSTGLGSHPAVTKYFYALASRFPTGEDQPPGLVKPIAKNRSDEEIMYGN